MARRCVFAFVIYLAAVRVAGADSILVYDDNTVHQLALQAALSTPGAVVVRADSSTFGTLLRSQAWDLVLADMPSTLPTAGGMAALADYVNAGGKAAMSFWTWQTEGAVSSAFGVRPEHDISLAGATLFDFGASSVFDGVTMPNGGWHDHWSDDGDVFALTRGGTFLAGLGSRSAPVMALTNGGRTIAAPLFDEAGGTWLSDGSGRRLWSNMIGALRAPTPTPVPEPATMALVGLGIGVVAARKRTR